MIKNQGERWWNKVEQRHDRSGIGNLIRPEDIYLSPWALDDRSSAFRGADLDQLGAVDILDADRSGLSEVEFHTRPTMRFHGAVPALIDAINSLIRQDARVLLTAPNQGEVERLAGLLQEYKVPYRLGSRNLAAGSETIYSESSYLAGSTSTPVIVRTPIANGVQVLDLEKATARQIVIFGANDLTDEADITARPATRKSKTSAFISDFRDLAVGDYVVHVEHGIAQYCGLRTIDEDNGNTLELMILEFADAGQALRPAHPPRPHPEVPLHRDRPRPRPQQARLASLAKDQGPRKESHGRHGRRAAQALRRTARPHTATPSPPTTTCSASSKTPSPSPKPTTSSPPSRDIKADMESTQPMDRLLCGDVGYGKTEVAMRAAFKAVQDGKQVAVLTPTTVLSFQHFESFKKRFANFPVNGRNALPLPHREGKSRYRRAGRSRQDRHPHRHPRHPRPEAQVPGSRPPRRR